MFRRLAAVDSILGETAAPMIQLPLSALCGGPSLIRDQIR